MPPARSGWLGRWHGFRSRAADRLERARRARIQAWLDSDAEMTPDLYPGLTPEACAFLNTPLEECDPEIACALFARLAEFITQELTGASDPDETQQLFDQIWGRFGPMLAAPERQTPPDSASIESTAPAAAAPLPPAGSSVPGQAAAPPPAAADDASHSGATSPAAGQAIAATQAIADPGLIPGLIPGLLPTDLSPAGLTPAGLIPNQGSVPGHGVPASQRTAPVAAEAPFDWPWMPLARRPITGQIAAELAVPRARDRRRPLRGRHQPRMRARPAPSALSARRFCYAACAGPP